MVTIYCIEDINDLKYVGSTTQKLRLRLDQHRYRKRKGCKEYSSEKLNLDNCIIYSLEECNKEDSFEREKYWINKLDCVNIYKFNYNRKEWVKKNREHVNEYQRERRKKLLLNPTI